MRCPFDRKLVVDQLGVDLFACDDVDHTVEGEADAKDECGQEGIEPGEAVDNDSGDSMEG